MPKGNDRHSGLEVPRLEVYLTRSVLVGPDGFIQEFKEGEPTAAARKRLNTIRAALETGFIERIIEECQRPDDVPPTLDPSHLALLDRLVESVTSEVGRAIVGLAFIQTAIKAICPGQSIRLHKGGARGDSFSWSEGIPMRVLDKNFFTPALRKYDLLKLNADGVFMTRSLAENYPYSKVYKAALRGARDAWLDLIDLLEKGEADPLVSLKHLIAMLSNRSAAFKRMAEETIKIARGASARIRSIDDAIRFMRGYVDKSEYSARVFEISMHSLFQVLEDARVLPGHLKPLSQMRSANKKHGNIGDIEIIARPDSMQILEAWDSKYGKPYLREELDELSEKLLDHPETSLAGFVLDRTPDLKREILERMSEIEHMRGTKIRIAVFDVWVLEQIKRARLKPEEVAKQWVVAFAESLCQIRRNRAPIDEPSDAWVKDLAKYAGKWR